MGLMKEHIIHNEQESTDFMCVLVESLFQILLIGWNITDF